MISVNRSILYGVAFNDVRCLSTDTKPTEGIVNGSFCIEIDTGNGFMFDEESKTWNAYSGPTPQLPPAYGEEF